MRYEDRRIPSGVTVGRSAYFDYQDRLNGFRRALTCLMPKEIGGSRFMHF